MKEVDQVLNRVMNLDTFLVCFELPEDFCFHGKIPFDLKIEDGFAMARVVALTQDEAEDIVQEYFDNAIEYWEDIVFTPEDDEEDDEDEDDDLEDAE